MTVTSSTKARFTIDVDGSARTLLSIGERRSGDLLIFIKQAGLYRPYLEPEPTDSVLTQKYSVHSTPDADEPVNVNKHTLIWERQGSKIGRQRTRAMKDGNLFAPLFVRRHVNLRPAHHILKSIAGDVVNIGEYDPNLFTLFLALFVSNRERAFNPVIADDIRMAEWIGGRFRLTALFTFLSIPSSIHGDIVHCETPQDEDGRPQLHGTAGGDEKMCIAFFKERSGQLAHDCIELEYPGESKCLVKVLGRFYRYGMPSKITTSYEFDLSRVKM